MQQVFDYIDQNKEKYIKLLDEAVRIKSVSAWKETRPEVDKMIRWLGSKLKDRGASIEYCEIGTQVMPDGSKIKLPHVLLAEFGKDPAKKTLLAYGHLDVQPAAKSDGWDYDPWVLTRSKDGQKFYGRGSTDDKGNFGMSLTILRCFCV